MMLRLMVLALTVALLGFGSTFVGAADSLDKATDKAKEAAGSAAKAVSDSWITMKTKMALLADEHVSSTDVHVDTRQGVVTLRGKVPSAEAKQAAEADAQKIDGAKRVINYLEVVPPAAQKSVNRHEPEADQH